jgi:hypothetical protein
MGQLNQSDAEVSEDVLSKKVLAGLRSLRNEKRKSMQKHRH